MANEIINVDGHDFELSTHEGTRGTDGPITLKKTAWMIERYRLLAEEFRGGRIVELGLWDGGSTAFLASAFAPSVLLGFELETVPLTALDRFLEGSPHAPNVHVTLGADQTDVELLRRTIDEHVDGLLDFVVDDASHLLGPTEISFDCLFPLVRPGGMFVIEDWSHEHQMAYMIRQALDAGDITVEDMGDISPDSIPSDPLSRLVIDCLIATSHDDGVIADVWVRQGWAEIRRGDAPLDPSTFSLRDHIGEIGRKVSPRP